MLNKKQYAAELLLGKVLADGWKVVNKIIKEGHKTGGAYSSCYEVENGERKGFLKGFDYAGAEKVSDKSSLEQLQNIVNAFVLEREMLEICTLHNCRNVITILSHGELEVEEAGKYPKVHYLILEYADKGDVRDALREERATLEFKLRSLHQLANGLNQIHKISIAHQDVKPSNIVTFQNNITKITDFGSAVSLSYDMNKLPDHLKNSYGGTWDYAPPELLYGETSSNEVIRRIGCDLYLLGSMIVFYFTNSSMTGLIRANLEDSLCWTNAQNIGRYKEIRPFLIAAFEQALVDIGNDINNDKIKDDLLLVIRYLCNPDPTLRGHKKNASYGPQYSLERFITIFDRLATIVSRQKVQV